ncbi:MAG: hypothetical protein Q8N37_03020 [bacterium]|nr:hypothetical protein [bacterium]
MSSQNRQGSISNFERSIFATIAYYDYFNYPLTAGEIYQYLIKPYPQCHPEFISGSIKAEKRDDKILKQVQDDTEQIKNDNLKIQDDNGKLSFSEIIEILDNSTILKKTIEQKNGFYFLRGRKEMIKQRIQSKKLTDQKFKRSKWILKFISYLPFIRLIMISGSTAIGNPQKESDIDLLIVAKYGRIWTARAALTFFTLLFGVYRHTGKTENRLCLNHYITDRSLGIDFGNLYKAEEYLNLLPLSGDLNLYKKFFKENSWIKNYTYSSSGSLEKNLRTIPLKGVSLKIKHFFEFLLSGFVGDRFEKYFKKLQVYFIEKNPLTGSPKARIRYNDSNLVFHPVLVEPEVIGKWKEKMAKFE